MTRRRFLLGPTAVGKTSLVISLARSRPIRVLSLDSMQVFRGMDVGTAKPTIQERAVCPHELLDLVPPWESFSVARYLEAAEACEARLIAEGAIPVFVGGTALYLKALLHGLFEGPAADPAVRRRLEEKALEEGGSVGLHAELEQVDPAAARRIHPNDLRRIVRALEVHELTGRPISELQREWSREGRTDALLVGLLRSRENLRERVRERVRAMLAAGWIEEVRGIEEGGGFSRSAQVALGYAQIRRFLAGELAEAELEEAIVTATQKFLRRQMTWFRSFEQIVWIDLDRTPEREALQRVAETLELS